MTKWIGKAALTVRPPRRVVRADPFHVGRAGSRSPFDALRYDELQQVRSSAV
jgi:hypothetical protein